VRGDDGNSGTQKFTRSVEIECQFQQTDARAGVTAVNQSIGNYELLAAARQVFRGDEARSGPVAGKDSEVGKAPQQCSIGRVFRQIVLREQIVVVYINDVWRAVDQQAMLIFIGREREERKGDIHAPRILEVAHKAVVVNGVHEGDCLRGSSRRFHLLHKAIAKLRSGNFSACLPRRLHRAHARLKECSRVELLSVGMLRIRQDGTRADQKNAEGRSCLHRGWEPVYLRLHSHKTIRPDAANK
jgi:hypothetical protein